jgi:hypothetical protein
MLAEVAAAAILGLVGLRGLRRQAAGRPAQASGAKAVTST